jgi:hypothetical protein
MSEECHKKRIICAWCQNVIQDGASNEQELSHGLCEECKPTVVAEANTATRRRNLKDPLI